VSFTHLDHLTEIINKVDHLLMVSDGSGKEYKMTYAWILLTPRGTRIAHCPGHCQGHERGAEATGMLSAAVFLAMIQQYQQGPPKQLDVRYISNNMELIKERGREHKEYTESYANTTLRAEYDVTKQIHVINHDNRITPTYTWVKGHQDKDTPKQFLPLLAQLNIEADELAGHFQTNHGKYSPIVPLLPASPAMLAIQGISIKMIKVQCVRIDGMCVCAHILSTGAARTSTVNSRFPSLFIRV